MLRDVKESPDCLNLLLLKFLQKDCYYIHPRIPTTIPSLPLALVHSMEFEELSREVQYRVLDMHTLKLNKKLHFQLQYCTVLVDDLKIDWRSRPDSKNENHLCP